MSDYGRLEALMKDDPARFRQLVKELNRYTLKPHEGQRLVLDSEARFKVMNCGRRWGKTKLAAHILTKKARQPRKMLWWVAPTYKIVKRGYEEVLNQLPPALLENPAPPSSHFDAGRSVILRFKNGTKMEFYSAERPEGMLGAGVDFVVLDEAAMMKPTIWNQIVAPTLMDHEGGALMISTPRARNWFYKVWQLGQSADEELWESWTFESASNPTLPPGEVERARRTTPRMEFEQEYLARFLAAGSSVFLLEDNAMQQNAVLDNGLIEDCPPKGHCVLGIDLARTNDYTVMYGARASDRRNVYFERFQDVAWQEQRRRIRRAHNMLLRNGASGVTLMVDEGNAGTVIVEDLEIAGFDVIGVNFTTAKAPMVRLLANDLETGMAFILEDYRDEFDEYVMDTTPSGRLQYSAPEGSHDDVVSAKMLQHWGLVNEGVPEVTILSPGEAPAERPQRDEELEDGEDADEPWADLLDEEPTDDPAVAAEEIGLVDDSRRPTPQELLLRPDVFF